MVRLALHLAVVTVVCVIAIWAGSYTLELLEGAPAKRLPGNDLADAPRPAVQSTKVNIVAMGGLGQYPDTALRPVFFKDRKYPERARPKAPVKQTIRRPKANIDGVTLSGVVVINGVGQALIEVGPKSNTWIKVGERLNGWQIESITQDEVALRDGQDLATLHLYPRGGKEAPKAKPPVKR